MLCLSKGFLQESSDLELCLHVQCCLQLRHHSRWAGALGTADWPRGTCGQADRFTRPSMMSHLARFPQRAHSLILEPTWRKGRVSNLSPFGLASSEQRMPHSPTPPGPVPFQGHQEVLAGAEGDGDEVPGLGHCLGLNCLDPGLLIKAGRKQRPWFIPRYTCR